jgi:hypothetical protein
MAEAEANGGTLLGHILRPYGVLRGNRSLQLLFAGQAVSAFGDWLYVLALGILAYEITGSATVVAVLTFARLLPYAALLPLSRVLADRGNRKVLMISADLGRGLCMLGLLFAGSEGTLWIAYPLVFLATVFSSLFKPAMNSVLPALAGDEENLLRANSIWSQMDSVSFVLGPALGGILALLGAPQLAFLINGITFLVSAGTLLLVRIPPRTAPEEKEGGEEEGWLSETLAGFRFLFRENEGVLAALTISFVGLTFVGQEGVVAAGGDQELPDGSLVAVERSQTEDGDDSFGGHRERHLETVNPLGFGDAAAESRLPGKQALAAGTDPHDGWYEGSIQDTVDLRTVGQGCRQVPLKSLKLGLQISDTPFELAMTYEVREVRAQVSVGEAEEVPLAPPPRPLREHGEG